MSFNVTDPIISLEQTAEEATHADIVDDGGCDSDSWMYGSDDEEDEEDEPQYSVLESIMQGTVGEKKHVTPRPHFKCSQCNKIFYGPLKFKSE